MQQQPLHPGQLVMVDIEGTSLDTDTERELQAARDYVHTLDTTALMAVRDGRVLFSYGDRASEFGKKGLEAMLSADGGETWTQTLSGTVGAVEISTSSPEVAYAADWDAVYRSDDGGRTWNRYFTDYNMPGQPSSGTYWGPPGMSRLSDRSPG